MAWVAILVDQRERIDVAKRLASAEEKLKEREKQAMIAELAGAAAHELRSDGLGGHPGGPARAHRRGQAPRQRRGEAQGAGEAGHDRRAGRGGGPRAPIGWPGWPSWWTSASASTWPSASPAPRRSSRSGRSRP